jgi:hypothetical protein
MAEISVSRTADDEYQVTVSEGSTTTTHVVTVTGSDAAAYGRGEDPEALLHASFRFLLAREPKESILNRFSLPVIERFFPDYPLVIGEYLSGDR